MQQRRLRDDKASAAGSSPAAVILAGACVVCLSLRCCAFSRVHGLGLG